MYKINFLRVLLLVIVLFLPITAYSLFQNTTMIVIKGAFTEEGTNKPISTLLQFIDSEGKSLESRTNANTGEFQQVLKPNANYILSAKGYIITPGRDHIKTPNTREYLEMNMNITAKKIAEGMQLMNIQAFKHNDSVLTYDAKQQFLDLRAFLRNNVAVTINIEISSYDSYLKEVKYKEHYMQGKAKKFRWKTITTRELLENLLNAREKSIRDYLDEIKVFNKNVEFSKDLQIVPESKKQEKRPKTKGRGFDYFLPDINNTKVTISKVRNL